MPLVSVEYVFQYLHFNYILRIHILLREQLSLPIRIGFDAYISRLKAVFSVKLVNFILIWRRQHTADLFTCRDNPCHLREIYINKSTIKSLFLLHFAFPLSSCFRMVDCYINVQDMATNCHIIDTKIWYYIH